VNAGEHPTDRTGPLCGVRIVELAGMGPGPMAGTVLADLGADVIRVDRAVDPPLYFGDPDNDVFGRGRRSIALDLKHPDGRRLVLDLVAVADALIEGFRPGVMERLGLGPDVCLACNPKLVYGRMTGWGQDGPMADRAGHDIDYIALAGALEPIGPAGQAPVPPLNLVGDYGGGGMLLAVGVLSGLLAVARGTAKGQVVDAAMIDGVALMLGGVYSQMAAGMWSATRGENALGGGAPYYGVFETADGQHVAVGAIEPQFWSRLLAALGLSDDPAIGPQRDRDSWPRTRARLAEVFASRTRDEWAAVFERVDACVAPVLSPFESPRHPHNAVRRTFVDVGGIVQPAPAPRFSATPGGLTTTNPAPGADTVPVLTELGLDRARIDDLLASGVVATA